MNTSAKIRLTELLRAWSGGDPVALDRLVPVVYDELRRIARHYMNAERTGHTLGSTGLVHEVFLRLVRTTGIDWEDRDHFFAVRSQMMRRILIDGARARAAGKRGGSAVRVGLDRATSIAERSVDLLALDDALTALARFDDRKARV